MPDWASAKLPVEQKIRTCGPKRRRRWEAGRNIRTLRIKHAAKSGRHVGSGAADVEFKVVG